MIAAAAFSATYGDHEVHPRSSGRHGLDSWRRVHDGNRFRFGLARRKACASGARRWVLDGRSRCHQCRVREVCRGHALRNHRRKNAVAGGDHEANAPGYAAAGSGTNWCRVAGVYTHRGPGAVERYFGLVEVDSRRQLAASRRSRRAISKAAKIIRSCKSLGTMPWPMPTGPASDCRRKPSGNSPPAAGSRAKITCGAIKPPAMKKSSPTFGRENFPTTTPRPTASSAPRR